MTNEELFTKAVSGDWLAEKFERPDVSGGVGKFILKGTSKGFAAFSDAIKDGQVVFFSAFDDNCNREAGFAVYNASEKSLTPVESNSALANGKYLSGDVRPIPFPDGGTICGTFNAEAFNTVWEHVHNKQNPHEVQASQVPQNNYNGLGDDVQVALDTLGKAISTLDPDALPDWQDVVRDDVEGNTGLLQRPLNRFIHEDGHGEWIVDEGGVPPGTAIGDVPVWKGREYVPVALITDSLLDVQSEGAKRDDFLIYNGDGKWNAKAFHIETTLHFMGAWDFNTDPPESPEAGDLYINTAEGKMSAGWGPLAGTDVLAGNMVGYSGNKGRWYLLGDVASSAVIQIVEGDCIVVDETQPDRPVVGITTACQEDIALGVEAHGWGDHAQDITDLNEKIDDLSTNGGQALEDLEQKVDDNKTEFDNHTHEIDDLTDVNATSPTMDDLLIWNGQGQWTSTDFKFIQTALRFKGGIAPTATAPGNPEGGDLYVFEEAGTIGASWGVIAGRVVQPGKFVGYAAGTNNRWFLLGDMADVGVMKVVKGTGVLVDETKPSEPVVSIDRTEVDKWYEPKFSKNTAFNKNFAGSGSATTVSRSDHTHSQYLIDETDPTVPAYVKAISTTQISNWDTAFGWGNHASQGYLKSGDIPGTDLSNYYTKTESDNKYEPKFAKNNAFNKSFGTTSGTVAQGNHTHSQYLTSGDAYSKAEIDALLEEISAGGGSMNREWVEQPVTCGDFTKIDGNDYYARPSGKTADGIKSVTFTVPDGFVFDLDFLTFRLWDTSVGGEATLRPESSIDGVPFGHTMTNYISTVNYNTWPQLQYSGYSEPVSLNLPHFQLGRQPVVSIKTSALFKVSFNYTGGSQSTHEIRLCGRFVKA